METNGLDASATMNEKDVLSTQSVKETAASFPSSEANPIETEIKARVNAVWEQMNKGMSSKTLNDLLKKGSSTVNKTSKKSSSSSANWKKYLGLAPKAAVSMEKDVPQKESSILQSSSSEEAKRIAAAALSAVKDAAVSTSGRGKVEIMEVRDFAGQEIEFKKLVDADSKEAFEKAKATAPSAVDAVLEQIKKKPKLSVLDKTRKDWGEFKEENKGLEDELDAYKKSSNQYLDKVSFLHRTDYREFERERDARLALQAKRRPDMREEP
ncbi:uncharacterized protein LOC107405440 isoform X2 [Ziziphus jujuba]|uniref:Uncharacterized protein LOC107405440 isoform X2 n=1 Tax=Ziziphus jujuba TaxID=326968 RepID=A0A6P4BLT0_ZIZJJ|nr:uncharacterized protein LOC107405440 isoform X2 [Ziziphus jujuba]